MIRSITRSITRPIVRSIVRAISAITRYFTSLDGVGGYYAITTPFAPAGDYEWESDFYFDGSLVRVFGNVAGFNSRVVVNADGSVDWRPENATATSLTLTAGTVSVTGLNNIRVKRSGATGEIFLNDVSVGSGVVPTGAALVDAFGNQGGSFSSGILANTKNTDLGAQLFTTFTSTDAGSSYIAGVLTLVQDSGQDFAVSDVSITSGTKYTIDYEVTSQDIDSDGELRVTTSAGNTTKALLAHTVGEHSVTFIADANYTMTLRLGNTNNGSVVVGDSWSVRETDNIVTTTFALDEPTANTELSVESGGVATTGGELVVNGDFATDLSGWATSGTDASNTVSWTINGARLNCVTANISLIQTATLIVGDSYVMTCDTSIVAGSIALGASSAGSDINLINGGNTVEFTATDTALNIKRTTVVTDATIDNISVKLASPSITYNNIAEADRELYTLVDGDWLGEEEVVNGDFATDLSGWTIVVTAPNLVEWVAGEAHLKRTISASNELRQNVFTIGKTYLVTINYRNVSVGVAIEGNGDLLRTNLVEGENSFRFTPSSITLQIIARDNGSEGYVDNISVKQLITVA